MDFESIHSEVLLNPRLTWNLDTQNIVNLFPSHCFIASSGTTRTDLNSLKLVALSKYALLNSANSVNYHLNATSKDIWLNVLPEFHVGGLGVLARAHLTHSQVVKLNKWNPQQFVSQIFLHSVTLTSLVPTQLSDLVALNLNSPPSLRAVIIGGGAINSTLYKKARELGWPLFLSYGLTECASQVATSYLNSEKLVILSHIEAKAEQGFIHIKSDSLLSSHVYIKDGNIEVVDPKVNGWLSTDDRGKIEGQVLKVEGRAVDYIKIGGEGVLMFKLEMKFEEIKLNSKCCNDAALISFPDERLGNVIHAVANCPIDSIVQRFNDAVMPYERIRKVHYVDRIPRSALNKVLKTELLQKIDNADL